MNMVLDLSSQSQVSIWKRALDFEWLVNYWSKQHSSTRHAPTPCLSCLASQWEIPRQSNNPSELRGKKKKQISSVLKHHWLLSLLGENRLLAERQNRGTTRQQDSPLMRTAAVRATTGAHWTEVMSEESPVLSTWPSHASLFSPEGLGFDVGMTSSRCDVTGPLFSPLLTQRCHSHLPSAPAGGFLQLNIAVELKHITMKNRKHKNTPHGSILTMWANNFREN